MNTFEEQLQHRLSLIIESCARVTPALKHIGREPSRCDPADAPTLFGSISMLPGSFDAPKLWFEELAVLHYRIDADQLLIELNLQGDVNQEKIFSVSCNYTMPDEAEAMFERLRKTLGSSLYPYTIYE